ncbi:MAG TPA: ATP-binding protein [Candidatus Dormibacteraeota bacterium]|nr:ATP-binding protein [Candidatus Dormibacteraeota bacterium]
MAPADCSQCRGTGYRTQTMNLFGVEARVAVPCDCGEGQRAARQLQRARIPRRYEHCDFDNFDTGLYESEPQATAWNRSLEQAKLVVEAFARDYPAGSEAGLLLMGPCGVGKTHLGVATLKQLAKRGHQCLFYDYRELLKEIQASYNPENGATEMRVLEPVLSAEVLLLDDMGASKPSPWALDTLGHILNSRYNEKRVTLITTNYLEGSAANPAEPTRQPSGERLSVAREDTLGERVGQRIRSRLYEMCRAVEVLAPDYRREVRQAGRARA